MTSPSAQLVGLELRPSAVRVEKVYVDKPKLSIKDKTSLNRLIYPSEVQYNQLAITMYNQLIDGKIVPRTTYLISVQADSEVGIEGEQWRLAEH